MHPEAPAQRRPGVSHNPTLEHMTARSWILATALTALSSPAQAQSSPHTSSWLEIPNRGDGVWQPRAGLQVVELGGSFYLMGGRTPINPAVLPVPGASTIWADVWRSDDFGTTWRPLSRNAWPARAYFRALEHRGEIYVVGGQNFKLRVSDTSPLPLPDSDFFSDVWSSTDGVQWTQRTSEAGWKGRAGLSCVSYRDELYIFGGSENDDESIIGAGGPVRLYFNDVWKSSDGVSWTQVSASAPWAARAGAVALVKDDYIYLLGGEAGFTCAPIPCTPPYFNDVWRTQDGLNWEQVTPVAAWPARPGHQVVVYGDQMVLFGGFGLSQNPAAPFEPSNPMDVWTSRDGASWTQVSGTPWNAMAPADIKYDFAALVAPTGLGPIGQSIFTFGGDRETFNFFNPTNFMQVDNDVWQYTPPPY